MFGCKGCWLGRVVVKPNNGTSVATPGSLQTAGQGHPQAKGGARQEASAGSLAAAVGGGTIWFMGDADQETGAGEGAKKRVAGQPAFCQGWELGASHGDQPSGVEVEAQAQGEDAPGTHRAQREGRCSQVLGTPPLLSENRKQGYTHAYLAQGPKTSGQGSGWWPPRVLPGVMICLTSKNCPKGC